VLGLDTGTCNAILRVYKNHETRVFMRFGTVLARFLVVSDKVPNCHLAPIGSDSVSFLPLYRGFESHVDVVDLGCSSNVARYARTMVGPFRLPVDASSTRKVQWRASSEGDPRCTRIARCPNRAVDGIHVGPLRSAIESRTT